MLVEATLANYKKLVLRGSVWVFDFGVARTQPLSRRLEMSRLATVCLMLVTIGGELVFQNCSALGRLRLKDGTFLGKGA